MNSYAGSVDELLNYLAIRSQDLSNCNADVENGLWSANESLIQRMNDPEDEAERVAVSSQMHENEKRTARTFRYMLLVSICSYVEESIKQITALRIPDFAGRLPKKGSQVDRYLTLFETDALVSNEVKQSLSDALTNLIWLRNCVVHAWGCVPAYRFPDEIRQTVDRINANKSPSLVEIDSRDYLWFRQDLNSHAICAADRVIDVLMDASFNRSFLMTRVSG